MRISVLLLSLALCFARSSLGIERLIVFGDSLSDTGNVYALTQGAVPPAPYGHTYSASGQDQGETFPGRFTDGPVWVDYLPGIAHAFGVLVRPATAYFLNPTDQNATDFAIGGATSGEFNVSVPGLPGFQGQFPIGFLSQVGIYLTAVNQQASATDLYVIWVGANDFAAQIEPAQTVANIENGIATLASKGAKNFLVVKIPDIALTPDVRAQGGAVFAANVSVFTTNVLLEIELRSFASRNRLDLEFADINTIFIPLVYSPGIFGFSNSSGDALNLATGQVVSDPNDYVFWDGFHPTTNAHYLAGKFIFGSVLARQVGQRF
jgi:phospholipase/lecithinase/hemolysin